MKRPDEEQTRGWNDRVTLACTHNLASGDAVMACLEEMAGVAAGSRCLQFLYTASINPDSAGGRDLTPVEAEESALMLLDALGFGPDHQWLLVRHEKAGRAHYHVVANRIDPVSLKSVDLSWNYIKHEQVARDLEQRFALRPTRGAFTGRKKGKHARFEDERPVSLMDTAEAQQAERTGLAVSYVIRDLCDGWEASGAAEAGNPAVGLRFAELLRQKGYLLAQGDRRDVVVVDTVGGVHNPAKRLGLKAREFRTAIRDLDIAGLPTVDGVRSCLRQAALAESHLDAPNTVPALQRPDSSSAPERNRVDPSPVVPK